MTINGILNQNTLAPYPQIATHLHLICEKTGAYARLGLIGRAQMESGKVKNCFKLVPYVNQQLAKPISDKIVSPVMNHCARFVSDNSEIAAGLAFIGSLIGVCVLANKYFSNLEADSVFDIGTQATLFIVGSFVSFHLIKFLRQTTEEKIYCLHQMEKNLVRLGTASLSNSSLTQGISALVFSVFAYSLYKNYQVSRSIGQMLNSDIFNTLALWFSVLTASPEALELFLKDVSRIVCDMKQCLRIKLCVERLQIDPLEILSRSQKQVREKEIKVLDDSKSQHLKRLQLSLKEALERQVTAKNAAESFIKSHMSWLSYVKSSMTGMSLRSELDKLETYLNVRQEALVKDIALCDEDIGTLTFHPDQNAQVRCKYAGLLSFRSSTCDLIKKKKEDLTAVLRDVTCKKSRLADIRLNYCQKGLRVEELLGLKADYLSSPQSLEDQAILSAIEALEDKMTSFRDTTTALNLVLSTTRSFTNDAFLSSFKKIVIDVTKNLALNPISIKSTQLIIVPMLLSLMHKS